MSTNIAKEVEEIMADQTLTPEEKRNALMEIAQQLVATNSEIKRMAAEVEIAADKKQQESQKCRECSNRYGQVHHSF